MLDFLYSDKECSRLLHYGIEGENYELIDNKYRYIDNFEVGSPSYGISNYNFDYKPYFEDDYAEKLYDEISSGVGKDSNYSKIKSFAPKLSDFDKYNNSLKLINQEYTIPRILGFVDDPREAIRIEKEMYKAAGIDDYTVEVQNQLDAYIKEKGLK